MARFRAGTLAIAMMRLLALLLVLAAMGLGAAALSSGLAAALPEASATPVAQIASNSKAEVVHRSPHSESVRYVAAREFPLSCRVLAATKDSMALWGTADGGQSWSSCGKMTNDPRESERVRRTIRVERDGLYGFIAQAMTNGNGGESRPPQSGEEPQFWVRVDTTPPRVEWTSVEVQSTSEGSSRRLVLAWQASDAAIALRPVTIRVATDAEGPWTTLAAGLPAQGRYVWPLDSRSPRVMFLRVEARDLAGNKGHSNWPHSITP